MKETGNIMPEKRVKDMINKEVLSVFGHAGKYIL